MEACELELRVRYAETDQMGIAHHSSYLVWFEAGRTEFMRERGRSYAQVEEAGWLLVVVEAQCRYRRPARYDDVLLVRSRLKALGPATLTFGYEIIRKADRETLADGYTVHAAVDRAGRVRRIPDEIRRLFAAARTEPAVGDAGGDAAAATGPARGGEPTQPAKGKGPGPRLA